MSQIDNQRFSQEEQDAYSLIFRELAADNDQSELVLMSQIAKLLSEKTVLPWKDQIFILLTAYRCNTKGPNPLFVPSFNLSQIKSLDDFKNVDREQVKKEIESNINNKAQAFDA